MSEAPSRTDSGTSGTAAPLAATAPSIPLGLSALKPALTPPLQPVALSIEDDEQSSRASARVMGAKFVQADSASNDAIPPSSMDDLSEGNSGHHEQKTTGILLIGGTLCAILLLGPFGAGFAAILTPVQAASFLLIPFTKKKRESVYVVDLTNVPKDSILQAVGGDSLVNPSSQANQIAAVIDIMKHLVGEEKANEIGRDLRAHPESLARFTADSELNTTLQRFLSVVNNARSTPTQVQQAKEQVVDKVGPILGLSDDQVADLKGRDTLTIKKFAEEIQRQHSARATTLTPPVRG